MAYASIDARIGNRKEVFTMSPLFNLIAFVLMSLNLLATPSLRQNDLMISGQGREAAAKNVINSDEGELSINMDETLTNSSVTNAVATQGIASSYFLDAIYVDAACSTVIIGGVLPLDLCMSIMSIGFIYTYSSLDKTISKKLYDNVECTGVGYIPNPDSGIYAGIYSTVEESCTTVYSLPNISAPFYMVSILCTIQIIFDVSHFRLQVAPIAHCIYPSICHQKNQL